jgi:hypothetical protein
MKKNILIAILSLALIGAVSWNYTQAAKAKTMPGPFTVETDDVNVGAAIMNQTRFGYLTGTFEVIPDPYSASSATTIILTYNAEE